MLWNKIHIAAWWMFVFVLSVSAQEINELTDRLHKSKTNEEKFYALTKLSDYWSYRDTARAFDMLREALPLTAENSFLKGIYCFYEAGVYFGHDNAKSQQLYMEAEEYLKTHDTPQAYHYRAKLWHNYGALEQQADNDKAFLDITLTHCIPFAEKSGDNNLLMSYFTNVGIIFYNHKELDKAMEYYMKAVSLAKTPEDETENLLWAYLNMFDVYFYENDADNAQHTLDKAEKMIQRFHGSNLAAVFYKNKAKFLNANGDYQNALASIETGMRVAQEHNFHWDFVSLKYEKALIYKMSGRWSESKKELEELLQNTANGITGKSRLALMNELSEAEFQLGNYRNAYDLMKEHKELSDSINAQNYKEQVADLETRYRTAEKEKEISILESKNRFQQTLFWGGSLLVFLLSMWIWYAWNARKKRAEKDLLLLKQRREIEISKALMDGEEQERKRLARDLHDGLVGRVTGLKMNVERIARDSRPDELPDVVTQLQTVITELRQTAHNLEPSTLKKQGLEDAIRHFCQSMQSAETNIVFYASGLSEIDDKKLQLSIYRIIQELITNAVRHADASEISLQSTFENKLLLIEIEDNGKGFNPDTTPRNMGLNNLESRVKSINGTLKIDSRPGEGTHIYIECRL